MKFIDRIMGIFAVLLLSLLTVLILRQIAQSIWTFFTKPRHFDDDEKILEGLIVSIYWKMCCDKFSSLEQIIDYLEYISDFNDQLPYLRKWENGDFSPYLVLGEWFCKNAQKN